MYFQIVKFESFKNKRMKKIVVGVVAFLVFSCTSKVTKEDISKLNGYWEIHQVKMATGEVKDYKVNATIDYFEVKNNVGFRQKVMPQFNGKFLTNGIKESIKIKEDKNAFFIEYTVDANCWQEEIIAIADSTMVLKNKQNIEYTYKKFKPFSFK